jgi:hypothetical protein
MRRLLLVLPMLALGCGHGRSNPGGRPTEQTPPSAQNDSSEGPPPLSREEIDSMMETIHHRIRTCPDHPPGSAAPRVHVKVDTNGRVSEVRTLGPITGTPAASCREQVIRLLVFRANPGTSFDYMFPID